MHHHQHYKRQALPLSGSSTYQPCPSLLPHPGSKESQDATIEQLTADNSVDLLVLARYMQIFTPAFCERNWKRTINIHHSFLPAFEGARPYHRAHERGVKIIGATAHYATSELDAGPIIEQGITRITHRWGGPGQWLPASMDAGMCGDAGIVLLEAAFAAGMAVCDSNRCSFHQQHAGMCP